MLKYAFNDNNYVYISLIMIRRARAIQRKIYKNLLMKNIPKFKLNNINFMIMMMNSLFSYSSPKIFKFQAKNLTRNKRQSQSLHKSNKVAVAKPVS